MTSRAVGNKILFRHTGTCLILSQCESSSALSVHVQVMSSVHTYTDRWQSVNDNKTDTNTESMFVRISIPWWVNPYMNIIEHNECVSELGSLQFNG